MTKIFALWIIFTLAATGEAEIKPMDMKFTSAGDCQYAANYFNNRATFGVYEIQPFYYCQVHRQESSL